MGWSDKIKNPLGGSSQKEERVGSIAPQKACRMMKIDGQWVEVDPATGKPITSTAPVAQKHHPSTAEPEVALSSPSGNNATLTAVEKPLVAPPLPAEPVDKTGGASVQSSPSADVSGNADAVRKDNGADRSAATEDATKAIPIDEEYLRKLYSAVEDNSKQAVEMIGGFNALVDMIQNLNADIVEKLGQKSARLDAANTELERLKADEVERIKVVDRLSRENTELKDKFDEYDALIADKDAEISRVTKDLKSEQEKCDEKDSEIAELNKARQDLEAAHADEIAKLKREHETAIAESKKKHGEELDALNKSAADQIEVVRKSVNEFVPTEVCELFDYRVGDAIDDRSRWQAIYAYLGFINGNLRQDAFVKRFREFDAALYDAMRDNPDQLAECRVRVQRHVNEEIGKKSGGLLVCWPKIGEACNPDQYTTTSDFGQRISEVISAMIYKKDDGGKVLCQSKGKVATV